MATNTAPSFTEHTAPSSGSTAGPYSISFSYIDENEVDVTVKYDDFNSNSMSDLKNFQIQLKIRQLM